MNWQDAKGTSNYFNKWGTGTSAGGALQENWRSRAKRKAGNGIRMQSKDRSGQFWLAILILIMGIAIVARGFRGNNRGYDPGATPMGHTYGLRPDLGEGARGRIIALSATSITVEGRDGTAKTFTITDATMVKIDGQTGSVSDLQYAHGAAVASTDGSTATSIYARTHIRRSGGRSGEEQPYGQ